MGSELALHIVIQLNFRMTSYLLVLLFLQGNKTLDFCSCMFL